MTRLPWSRRLTVLLVLAALAAASWGAAAVAPGPTFGTPAPAPGDAWTYKADNATLVEGLRGRAWAVHHLTLVAGGPMQASDQAGYVHDATLLVEDLDLRDRDDPADEDGFPVRREHAVGGDGRVVASREDGAWGLGGAQGDVIGPDGQVLGEQSVTMTRHDWSRGPGLAPLCGHRHSLQGNAAPLGKALVLQGGCARFGGPQASIRLPHRGAEEWQGRPVQRYAADGVEALLDPSLALPVRITIGGTSLELQGVGSGEAPEAAPWAAGPLPALAAAPRQRWGPADGDVAHPFPLSSAFAAALADDGSGVRSYLAGHPSAQVVEAAYRVRTVYNDERTDIERTWNLTLSDGASMHGTAAVQTETQTSRRAPLLLPEAVAAPLRQVRFDAYTPTSTAWPAPVALPATMPTAASILARAEAVASSGLPADSWGFRLACARTAAGAPDCTRAVTTVTGGHESVAASHEAQVGFALASWWMVEVRRTSMDADGNVLEHREAGMERRETFKLGPLQDGGLPEAEPRSSATAAVPTAGRAVGALTLAAAVGYALWLLAKLGAGLLFTRVQLDRVLEHPRRAALMQAIEAEPGIHFRDLVRRTGLAAGTARHHLRALATADQLTVVQGPRYQCYFPKGQDRRVTAVAGLLKSPVARGIVQATEATPLSGQGLAARLGVAPGAVSYHVQRLADAGLVTQRRDGRNLLVQATDLGRSAAV